MNFASVEIRRPPPRLNLLVQNLGYCQSHPLAGAVRRAAQGPSLVVAPTSVCWNWMTDADYVIHMDPWWNPAVEDQASDRAHRIGQRRPVTIYRLVTRNT
ncbi:MAG: DEAD/DEAH box helicase, partial [Syntrophobacter sp.]